MSAFTMIRSFLAMKLHEKYSREHILKLQEKKFRKMLKYSYKNSEFYRNYYSSKGIKESDLDTIDIENIPPVDKALIMDHFNELLTVSDVTQQQLLDFLDKSEDANNLFLDKYHVIHTSGSSCKLGLFVYSKKEWDTFYPYITKLFPFNFRRSKSCFVGATGGHFTGNSFISWSKKGIASFFNKPLILDINDSIDGLIKKINDFQPTILGGYFNGIKVLAQKQESGELHISPKILTNCGEGINAKDKEYIEEVFGAKMANLYGFAECVVSGFGRDEYDGIYLMDDICMIEIKEDHILLTNLFNKTEPLIRYRIDDYLKLKEDVNKKLPFTLVENIVGRVEFVIWFENDDGNMDFIHPLVFADFFVSGLDRLQVVITGKKSFDFRAVISSEDKEVVKAKIREALNKILADKKFSSVDFSIVEVERIDADEKTGKFRLVTTQS